MDNHFDVIVIGAGAAGLTSGIYLSRAKVKTLILNEGAVGGQREVRQKMRGNRPIALPCSKASQGDTPAGH